MAKLNNKDRLNNLGTTGQNDMISYYTGYRQNTDNNNVITDLGMTVQQLRCHPVLHTVHLRPPQLLILSYKSLLRLFSFCLVFLLLL